MLHAHVVTRHLVSEKVQPRQCSGCARLSKVSEDKLSGAEKGERSFTSQLPGGSVDKDLDAMSREQLIEEVRNLRAGIRTHRDSTGNL